MTFKKDKPEKKLAAACGLFCPSCTIYIATHEDPERLESFAKHLNLSIEETKCFGCRSENRNSKCGDCFMWDCTQKKGIDFCIDCADYPCSELKEFQSRMPHRLEMWKDLEKIKKIGWEKWYLCQVKNYECNICGTLNSGWDIKCRKCNNEPSCNYIENNLSEIKQRMHKKL